MAKADPDGYTLLAAMDSTMVLNPLVKKELRTFTTTSVGRLFDSVAALFRGLPSRA